jgi:hypothetical protein
VPDGFVAVGNLLGLVDEKDCFPVWLAKAGVQEVA